MYDYVGPEELGKRRQEISDEVKQKREALLEDMRWVLADARGRRVLINMLSHCRMGVTNFTGNSETFKLEGKREVGLAFLNWIKQASPDEARKIVSSLFVGEDT